MAEEIFSGLDMDDDVDAVVQIDGELEGVLDDKDPEGSAGLDDAGEAAAAAAKSGCLGSTLISARNGNFSSSDAFFNSAAKVLPRPSSW